MGKKHERRTLAAAELAKTFRTASSEKIMEEYKQFRTEALSSPGLYDELKNALQLNEVFIEQKKWKKKVYEIFCAWVDVCKNIVSMKTIFEAYTKKDLYEIRKCVIVSMVELKDFFGQEFGNKKNYGIKVLAVMQDMLWAYCDSGAREKMMDYLYEIVSWVSEHDESCRAYYGEDAGKWILDRTKKLKAVGEKNKAKETKGISKAISLAAVIVVLLVIGVCMFLGMLKRGDTGKDSISEQQMELLVKENEFLREENETLKKLIDELETKLEDKNSETPKTGFNDIINED